MEDTFNFCQECTGILRTETSKNCFLYFSVLPFGKKKKHYAFKIPLLKNNEQHDIKLEKTKVKKGKLG